MEDKMIMEYTFDDVKKMILDDVDIEDTIGKISFVDVKYTFDLLEFIMNKYKITPDEMMQALQEYSEK